VAKSKKTGNKWMTVRCARCGSAHTGYSGKVDRTGVEYVVCGNTNKRMDITGGKPPYFTTWILQSPPREEQVDGCK